MLLQILHTTTYRYHEPVSACYTETRITPSSGTDQLLLEHTIEIDPQPDFAVSRKDYFGNAVTAFSVHQSHQTLTIRSRSLVETRDPGPIFAELTPPWESIRDAPRCTGSIRDIEPLQFRFDSPRVTPGHEFAAYAAPSFPPGRPVLECAIDLCHRIFRDFTYDGTATTVTTPALQALHTRRGVCQDFAHVMITCLRSLGLPARYISGYLLTGDTAIGANASHAWMAIFCPGLGWLDLDPTNDALPGATYVIVGWGRDYSDVPPVKGITLGGGPQMIDVDVRVSRAAQAAVPLAPPPG